MLEIVGFILNIIMDYKVACLDMSDNYWSSLAIYSTLSWITKLLQFFYNTCIYRNKCSGVNIQTVSIIAFYLVKSNHI